MALQILSKKIQLYNYETNYVFHFVRYPNIE